VPAALPMRHRHHGRQLTPHHCFVETSGAHARKCVMIAFVLILLLFP